MRKQNSQSAGELFAAWLKNVPSLADAGEEITIQVPVTLSVSMWLLVAHVAAVHGETIEQTVNRMVYDVALEDDFMNAPWLHLWEIREKRDARIDAREAAKAKLKPTEDPEDGDEWKKDDDGQEGGAK